MLSWTSSSPQRSVFVVVEDDMNNEDNFRTKSWRWQLQRRVAVESTTTSMTWQPSHCDDDVLDDNVYDDDADVLVALKFYYNHCRHHGWRHGLWRPRQRRLENAAVNDDVNDVTTLSSQWRDDLGHRNDHDGDFTLRRRWCRGRHHHSVDITVTPYTTTTTTA